MAVRPLLGTVSATLPTLHGDVSISVNAATGTHSLTVPTGVRLAELRLPLDNSCTKIESVTLNGVEAPAGFGVIESAPWQRGDGLFDTHLRCDGIDSVLGDALRRRPAATAMKIQIEIGCEATEAVEGLQGPVLEMYGPPSWDVPMVGSDTATHGGWVGRYGSHGHLMFGLDGVNGSSNLAKPYLVGVEYRAGTESDHRNFPSTMVEPTDPRYPAALQLPCPPGPKQCARGIGNLATSSIEPMMIEVTLRPSLLSVLQRRCLNISLYFVDWDGIDDPITGSGDVVQRRTAVDVFTVAPGLAIDVGYATAVVGHPQLEGGAYRTWRACEDVLTPNATGFAAVRFRVYVVTGLNATVSAIFFD